MPWETTVAGGLARMDAPELIGLLLALFALASHVVATLSSLWMHGRCPRRAASLPHVTVFKPLRGLDDQLEENLESMFRVDYAPYEVLLCAADPDDPSLEVARRVAARHPEVPSRVVVGELPVGLNPKIRILAHAARFARGELYMVSDSNVRVRPSWLRDTVAELSDPTVAVASNLVAGVGERSLGATLENLQLNGFIAPAICMALALRRPPCLVGKSMVVRREDLEAVGGWEALGQVLAEDYLLGRLLEARGRRAAISPHVVDTINERWSVGRFVERHDRWLKMRWRIDARACLYEMTANVTAMSLTWVVLAGGAAHALAGAALIVAGRIALEAVSSRSLKGGRSTALGPLLLVPVRDLALAALWVHARLSARIRWRGGHDLLIGRGTVLSPADEGLVPSSEPVRPFPQPASGPARAVGRP